MGLKITLSQTAGGCYYMTGSEDCRSSWTGVKALGVRLADNSKLYLPVMFTFLSFPFGRRWLVCGSPPFYLRGVPDACHVRGGFQWGMCGNEMVNGGSAAVCPCNGEWPGRVLRAFSSIREAGPSACSQRPAPRVRKGLGMRNSAPGSVRNEPTFRSRWRSGRPSRLLICCCRR